MFRGTNASKLMDATHASAMDTLNCESGLLPTEFCSVIYISPLLDIDRAARAQGHSTLIHHLIDGVCPARPLRDSTASPSLNITIMEPALIRGFTSYPPCSPRHQS